MITYAQIKEYMLDELANNPNDYTEPMTGEINSTLLAESAAHYFDHAEWLDDETHDVWDAAVDVL